MNKGKSFNILDFGISKIRFSVFDQSFKEKYFDSKSISLENNYSNHFITIENIIKNSEKSISNHIEDIIVTLDPIELFTIDLSLKKNLDGKVKILKVFDSLLLELNQIINSSYSKFRIVHTIIDSCIIDNKFYEELPKPEIEISKIKVHFKVICFPNKIINDLKYMFNKININVLNFYCTSFVKSLSHMRKLSLDNACFLEIGLNRTSLINYKKNKLKFIQTVPIGGFNITKDIAKVFNIPLKDAEKIKKSFSKSETEFSYTDNSNHTEITLKEIITKNISINLLKKVILYRVQEIIDVAFEKLNIQNHFVNLDDTELFLIGDGSIIFKDNSFDLKNKYQFKNISYYNETDNEICNAGLVYYLNNYEIPKITKKKQGLFEKFFNFFEK